jgi:hypothetical protein
VELLNPLSDSVYTARTASFTATAASTDPWPPGAQGVVVWCTKDAYIAVGVGVTATTADTPIPANTPIPFRVPPGTGAPWRVSAIRVADDGVLYAKPINEN